jgi:hypothetical protein
LETDFTSLSFIQCTLNIKGVRKTMVEILITAYLVAGAFASGLIWAVLIASKRREDKAKNINYRQSSYALFREGNTKPSRFHF